MIKKKDLINYLQENSTPVKWYGGALNVFAKEFY